MGDDSPAPTLQVKAAAHDPVFERFPPFEGHVPTEFFVDFVGCRTHASFHPKSGGTDRESTSIQTEWPGLNEEYYEWVDLLEAVLAAGESFTMLELGAGYGRWAARSAVAARHRGIQRIKLAVVEPEPMHVHMMRRHFADNGISEDMVDIYEGVISEDPGETLFYVRQHVQDVTGDMPTDWYGQYKVQVGSSEPLGFASKAYFGHDLHVFANGNGAIKVPQLQASKLIRNYDSIDLIDLDVQGEELVVLYGAIDAINRNTKRLHIGTHAAYIEEGLREMLTANKWRCIRDYAGNKTNETPVGAIAFQDGIQTWINPRVE